MIPAFSEGTATGSEVGAGRIKHAERRAFVEWISLPVHQREPASLRQWAAHNNVHYETAKRWSKDTRIYAEAADRLGRHIDLEIIPGVVQNLANIAQKKQTGVAVAASKVLIDYLRWHVERTKDDATDVSKLSDAELRELMLEALDEYDVRTPLPS